MRARRSNVRARSSSTRSPDTLKPPHHIMDANLRGALKELAQLDGAFVISDDYVFHQQSPFDNVEQFYPSAEFAASLPPYSTAAFA
jgi:hypothetical protein